MQRAGRRYRQLRDRASDVIRTAAIPCGSVIQPQSYDAFRVIALQVAKRRGVDSAGRGVVFESGKNPSDQAAPPPRVGGVDSDDGRRPRRVDNADARGRVCLLDAIEKIAWLRGVGQEARRFRGESPGGTEVSGGERAFPAFQGGSRSPFKPTLPFVDEREIQPLESLSEDRQGRADYAVVFCLPGRSEHAAADRLDRLANPARVRRALVQCVQDRERVLRVSRAESRLSVGPEERHERRVETWPTRVVALETRQVIEGSREVLLAGKASRLGQ